MCTDLLRDQKLETEDESGDGCEIGGAFYTISRKLAVTYLEPDTSTHTMASRTLRIGESEIQILIYILFG